MKKKIRINKMEEDENVGVCRRKNDSRVSIMNRLASLRAITAIPFRIGGILQGITSKSVAFIAIASNTISAAIASSSQFSSHDLDAIVASDTVSDYLFDSVDQRIYRNVSMNAPTVPTMPLVPVSGTNESDSGENVTMASIGNNLLAAVTSTFSAIKTNDTANVLAQSNLSSITETDIESTTSPMIDDQNNYWALSALILVAGTAAGNILVCLAITWERRLQNVTNYFLMSLAITDLMVAILVMPLGILSLVKGEYKVILVFSVFVVCVFLPCSLSGK